MFTKIPFTKMHGLGNDFVMLSDATVAQLGLDPDNNKPALEKLAIALCDRHFGIGADGLIFPAPPTDPTKYDIRFVYINSDGSWAEMCGNGIRCFALYVKDLGLVTKNEFTVETPAGPIRPKINPDQSVTVDMGAPILASAKIPFVSTQNGISADAPAQRYPIPVLEQQVPVTTVSMGNPHCLIFQEELPNKLDPAVFGPAIEKHPYFPAKTNVEFVETLSRNHLKITVWERGCGFTLACGTGACATAVGAILLDKADAGRDIDVDLPGGTLKINWAGAAQSPVLMSGPATYVFTGEVNIPSHVLPVG